ncbi:helix-turn-helix domain-containing protein [Methylopila turkensis]|nr:AraC family transcriptional regulator [Methylopila turkensis]
MAAFRPRMDARRDGITVLGGPRAHASEAGLVEVWRARCEAGARGDYVSLDPRLFIVLEPLAADIALDAGAGRVASRAVSASYVPAGAPVRLSVDFATDVRHLDVHFDPRRIGPLDGPSSGRAQEPRLMFADGRVQRFARLLDAASRNPIAVSSLYGDGLVAALVAAALSPAGDISRRSALSDRQLKLAIDYIEELCAEPIRLQDLAQLTGLSETYFSHAFKAATGMPPHRWQLEARVRRAKTLLAEGDMSLIDVAITTGFSDQPHFTRVFKRFTGLTPLAWRAERRNGAPPTPD